MDRRGDPGDRLIVPLHVFSVAEIDAVLARRVALGEDWHVVSKELDEQEDEQRRQAESRRRFLEDGSELLDGGEQLGQQGRGQIFELYGDLLDDVVSRLPQQTPWVIETRDLLEWIRVPKDQRHAIGERIVRAAVPRQPDRAAPRAARWAFTGVPR